MFLDIQIDLIILKTYDQQFTLTTKKSLHIIFKKSFIFNAEVDNYRPNTLSVSSVNMSMLLFKCDILWPFSAGITATKPTVTQVSVTNQCQALSSGIIPA